MLLSPMQSDDCAGLLPDSLADGVLVELGPAGSDLACFDGGSDDGPAMSPSAGRNGRGRGGELQVFDSAGQPLREFSGPNLSVFSQPSGFTALSRSSTDGAKLAYYAYDGTMTVLQYLDGNPLDPVVAAPDPSGGTLVLRAFQSGSWIVSARRYSATGNPGNEVWVSGVAGKPALLGAVDLAGNALALWFDGESTRGSWLDPSGANRTQLSPSNSYYSAAQFLYGSGLALRSAPPHSAPGLWESHLYDSHRTLSPLPAWLQDRPSARFAAIRHGAGYAAWDLSLPGQVEIISARGNSCGSFTTPNASGPYSVGRDGTLISHGDSVKGISCGFRYWPQLLQ